MRRLSLVVPLGLLGAAAAQTTHVVGPGGYPDIGAAIAVAAPGDIVVVLPGTYQAFSLTIGLTIRALTPGTVHVLGGWGPLSSAPVGQASHFVGLDFDWLYVHGRLTLDECTLISSAGLSGQPLSCFLAELHLQRCLVRGLPGNGPSEALRASQSDVTATGCTFEGPGASFVSGPGPAVGLFGSTLRASHSAFTAGGASSLNNPAVWADAASTVWLADSTLTSGLASCPIAANNGRYARCTLTPPCASIPAGSVIGVHAPQPLQNGTTFVLEVRAVPNAPIGVFAAFDLADTAVPILEQTLLLPAASAVSAGFFVADLTGFVAASWPIPAGPAFVDRSLWFQAFDASSLPFQASGVAGGIVR